MKNVLSILLFLSLAAPLAAQTTWTGAAGDRLFTNADNWTNGVPSGTNPATIDIAAGAEGAGNGISAVNLAGAAKLTVAANGTLYVHDNNNPYVVENQLRFGGSSELIVAGGTVISAAYALFGIGNGAGTLTITDGEFRPTKDVFTIGDSPNQTGTVNLSGGKLNIQTATTFANHPGTKGFLYQTNGELTYNGTIVLGNAGSAAYYFTGGTVNAGFQLGGSMTSNDVKTYGTGTIHVGQDAAGNHVVSEMTLVNGKGMSIGAGGSRDVTSTVTIHEGSTLTNANTDRAKLQIGNAGKGVMNLEAGTNFYNGRGFFVGYSATSEGILNAAAGSTITAGSDTYDGSVAVGQGTGSLGTIELSGSMTVGTAAKSGILYIGDNGSGTINVNAGGSLNAGTLNVGYANGSQGTLEVKAGGLVTAGMADKYVGTLSLGTNGGASGTMNVSGTVEMPMLTTTHGTTGKTSFTRSYLYVGNSGSGTMNVNAGGSVTTGRLCGGNAAGSLGVLNIIGEGAALTVNADILWGNSSTGTRDGEGNITAYGSTMNIGDGGKLVLKSTDNGSNASKAAYDTSFIGVNANSTAVINVNAGGALELCESGAGDQTLYIANNGTGVVNYNSEKTSIMYGTLRLGGGAAGVGTLNVTNGMMDLRGSYFILSNAGTSYLNVQGGIVKNSSNFFSGDSMNTASHSYITVQGLYDGETLVRSGVLEANGNMSLSDKNKSETVVTVGKGGTFTSNATKIGYSNHWTQTSQQDGGRVEFNVTGGTYTAKSDVLVGKTTEINVTDGSFIANRNLIIYGTAQQGFEASSITVTGGTFKVGNTLKQYENTSIYFDPQSADISLGGLEMNGGTLTLKAYDTDEALLIVDGNIKFNGVNIVLDTDEDYWKTHTYGDDIQLFSTEGTFDWTESQVFFTAPSGLPEAVWSLQMQDGVLSAHVGVPEPAAWALMLLGLASLAELRRMKRNK